MKNKLTILLIFFLGVLSINSQNVYKEKLGKCNTERFILESVKKTAEIENDELVKSIFKLISKEQRKKIRGKLKLQIIVYKEGNSCLFSYENETNLESIEMDFEGYKNFIDNNLKWKNGNQNVAALIEVKFRRKKIEFTRFGMNTNIGLHKLK